MTLQRQAIDEVLQRTLDDGRLSRSEGRVLTELLVEHRDDPEHLDYFRHRAFEMARGKLPGSSTIRVLDWLEDVVKALARARPRDAAPHLAEAHFSPGDRCLRRIVSLVRSARRSADICVFTITDDRIAGAILEAHRRGVRVRLISDDDKAWDRGSDTLDLARAGVPLRMDRTEAHMHHKFALFDGALLVTGSYNWTRQAAADNEENLVVTGDPTLVAAFRAEFDRLWQRFGPEP